LPRTFTAYICKAIDITRRHSAQQARESAAAQPVQAEAAAAEVMTMTMGGGGEGLLTGLFGMESGPELSTKTAIHCARVLLSFFLIRGPGGGTPLFNFSWAKSLQSKGVLHRHFAWSDILPSATISRQFQKIYKFLSQSEIVTKQFFYFFQIVRNCNNVNSARVAFAVCSPLLKIVLLLIIIIAALAILVVV
jgi:hypothetical protein